MANQVPAKAKELRSSYKLDGHLHLTIEEFPVPEPKAHEVVVRIEATAINPSDVGVVLGLATVGSSENVGTNANPKIPIKVPESLATVYKKRQGLSLPAGNEGAGVVVAAGADAQHLMGKMVALFGANTYAQYRCVPAAAVLPMNEGTTAKEAAASCVNPLTVLAMVETMRMEGHTAMINTAAASNLGQMLVKVCKADDVPLINIVRKREQVELLQSIGAKYVVNSSEPGFFTSLVAAIKETGATLGFDAIGGGKMVNTILSAMEVAEQAKMEAFSIYGSTTLKQVYIYGGLSPEPTKLARSYGMYWSVGGWLVTPIIQKVGGKKFAEMKQRVADEIKTTFKSDFYKEVSLEEAILPETISEYAKQESGKKFLIRPQVQ